MAENGYKQATRKAPVNLKNRSKLSVYEWPKTAMRDVPRPAPMKKAAGTDPAASFLRQVLQQVQKLLATHLGVHIGERAGHRGAERIHGSDHDSSDTGSNQAIFNGSGAGLAVGKTFEKLAHVSLLWINPKEGTPLVAVPLWVLAVGTGHQITCCRL
jgi:hypothetical protein